MKGIITKKDSESIISIYKPLITNQNPKIRKFVIDIYEKIIEE
jgi:hypothetical protein